MDKKRPTRVNTRGTSRPSSKPTSRPTEQSPKKQPTPKRVFKPVALESQSTDTPAWQWLLVGAAALGLVWGASERTENTRRPMYTSREACLRDWNEPRDCEEGSEGHSRVGSARVWYGPDVDTEGRAYHADGRVTQGHRHLSTTSFRGSSITRSGFGQGFTRGG